MNKSSLRINTIISTCTLFLFCFIYGNAQERGIHELKSNTKVTSKFSSKSAKGNKKNDIERDRFYDLAFKLQPTIYINNSLVTTKNNKKPPIKIKMSDVNSFGKLEELAIKHKDIALIYLTLYKNSDLNSILDLSSINGFDNLKYVYVRCLFDCDDSQIKKFVKTATNSSIRVFYKTQTPS